MNAVQSALFGHISNSTGHSLSDFKLCFTPAFGFDTNGLADKTTSSNE